jgi:hypothetical protein
MPNDQAIENQIKAKGLNAPRISLAHVQSMMLRIGYRLWAEMNHG